jgi:hypothetical protein
MPYFNRFDVCQAWYIFASEWHGGQSSRLYLVFGRLARLRFNPGPMLSRDSLTDNGRAILANLIRRERARIRLHAHC